VGNPHVGFDEAGAGNGLLGTAPVLDPTCEGLGVRFPRATHLVLCFQDAADARAFGNRLKERLSEFGLKISEEKSRILAFGRYLQAVMHC